MSNAISPASSPLSHHSVGADIPETESKRWNAWLARGVAHERVVRRRFNRLAIVLCAAVVAVLFYTWFGPWS
jgi:hypothetical protein